MTDGRVGLSVDASNHSPTGDIDLDRWARVATETLRAEGVERGHLDLIFVDAVEMAELNQSHMGHSGPTDVLSFPLDGGHVGGKIEGDESPDPLPLLLGDVVICPQVAARQAPDHCGDLDAEFTLLVVHGVLHVLGHDHADPQDRAVMVDRETMHLARYGLAHPGEQGETPGGPT